ncbi:MAG TPA: hypothetical protein DIW42_08120, partial [Alcanivorax sp.]|nr:hypothetical protein [Alcanivorax sp.]
MPQRLPRRRRGVGAGRGGRHRRPRPGRWPGSGAVIPRFALATGQVWHQRHTPMRHAFRYPLWLVWCDVDAPDRMLARQRLWGRRWR